MDFGSVMPSLCSKSLKQNYNNLVVIWNVLELAQEWRGDKQLRQLEAMLIVMDKDAILVVAGLEKSLHLMMI